ncbi:MAG: hypothetical protein ACYDEF_10435 [Methanosarcina sp.]
MDETPAKPGSDSKDVKGDGFKFAVTLIIAFSSVGYKIYDYVENNPISDNLYVLLRILIPIAFTTLGLIIYIIIKGISLEINCPVDKEKLENISSFVYVSTLRLLIFYILYYSMSYLGDLSVSGKSLSNIVSPHFDQEAWPLVQLLYGMLIFSCIFPKMVGFNSFKKIDSFFIAYLLFVLAVTFLSCLGTIISPCFFTGDIEVEMDDTYYINDNHIPIYLVNTGYNGDITINLTKNKMYIDSIKLHPEKNNNEIVFGKYKYLHSSTLDYGKYKVYINATNLTEGSYELSVSEEFQKSPWTPIVSSLIPWIPTMEKIFYSFYLAKVG